MPTKKTPAKKAATKRPKSALMRDRKYESSQPHEKNYKRKTDPKHPHYKKRATKKKV